jgi:hypothetical protein
MSIKCNVCCKEVSYESIDYGKAEHRFLPTYTSYSALTDKITITPGGNEYTCEKCSKERIRAFKKLCNGNFHGEE